MRCKLCGKSTKQIEQKHCWSKQHCGNCHYFGLLAMITVKYD